MEDSSQPWAGGLSALAKTAAIEWPNARVKAIRLDAGGRAPETIAHLILDELLAKLSSQTGLTFQREMRMVDVWTLTPATASTQP